MAFVLGASLSYAQGGPLTEQIQRTILRKTRSISVVSQQTNDALYKRLNALFQPPTLPSVPARPQLPEITKPITFRVQAGPLTSATASAFAIEKDGRLFGVTAAHVMENISHMPCMAFQIAPNEYDIARITSWRKGNPFNVDVAVFEIPEEAVPYVQPLPLAEAPLQPQQQVSIAGFVHDEPLWLPQEEVLFVGAKRGFVRNTFGKSLSGMCGSPIMADGKVAGLYVGFTRQETGSPRQGWVSVLNAVSSSPLPPLHQIVFMDQVTPLIESLEKDTDPEGSVLKVMGFPVTLLDVEDQLVTIQVIRNGVPVKHIYSGPLADPEHLEQFLNIKENDVVSVSVLRKNKDFQTYNVNVSTGEVTLQPF